jgi:DHA3 family macrolide efflux protein-like MFS transporter
MKNNLLNRNFIFLMLVQTIEQIGDSLMLMSLIAWVMSMPGKATTANMTILLFWIGLPIILIGPFSGVLIDRFKRKTLLVIATAFKGAFIFLSWFFIKDPGLVPLIYFFVFMKSFATQFFIPAKSAFVPDIVNDRASLVQANSISTTAMVIVQITTYAAAGVLIAEFGPRNVLFASALLYIPAVLFIIAINAKEHLKTAGKLESVRHMVDDLLAGFKFMMKNYKVAFITRRVFIMMICIIVFYIALTGGVLERMLGLSGLKLKTIGALGFMQAALGAGLVLGVIFIEKFVKKFGDTMLIRFIFPLIGVLIAAMYIFDNYYYLIACAVMGGMGGMMVLSLAETAIQHETPENMRGRIFSAYYVFRNTGPLIASGIAGFLIRFMSEEKVMLMAGLALVVYGIINIFAKKNS